MALSMGFRNRYIYYRSCFFMSKYMSTMNSFKSEKLFLLYTFVFSRKNLGNFTKYIYNNVLTLPNSFPPSIATMIAGCDKPVSDDVGLLTPLVHNSKQ